MNSILYSPPKMAVWNGRLDSNDDFDAFRWHQWIRPINLKNPLMHPKDQILGVAFLGFCCDEGVRRNLGRPGSSKGPDSIRKELSNLPCWFTPDVRLYDAGDILCPDGDLEQSQAALSTAVSTILNSGLFPIVLGGGHEIALGHYNGISNHLSKIQQDFKLGIINFDAHFDLRPYNSGGSSGTMFRQIADFCQQMNRAFSYLCLGVQRYCNTAALFKTARELGVSYVLSKDIAGDGLWPALEETHHFIASSDHLYLTICSDVFSSAFAPGVSASQPVGLEPEQALKLIKQIIRSGKVRGFDIAEVSPRFDQDNTTANLAKVLIFTVVNALSENLGLERHP